MSFTWFLIRKVTNATQEKFSMYIQTLQKKINKPQEETEKHACHVDSRTRLIATSLQFFHSQVGHQAGYFCSNIFCWRRFENSLHGRTAQLQRSALKCHGRALRDISELRLPSIGWTQYPLPIHCPDQINAIPIKWQWSAEARRLKCDWIWFVICSIQSMCDNFWKRTEQTGATTVADGAYALR